MGNKIWDQEAKAWGHGARVRYEELPFTLREYARLKALCKREMAPSILRLPWLDLPKSLGFIKKSWPEKYILFTMPLEEIPLHLNNILKTIQLIAWWRLKIGK